MLIQFVIATGVLAMLTMAPGLDMAVVTMRAVACGQQGGLRTAGGITAELLVWAVLAAADSAAVPGLCAASGGLASPVGRYYGVELVGERVALGI